MAAALREGHLGVLDYYRMENLRADTDMRNKIGGPGDSQTSPAE